MIPTLVISSLLTLQVVLGLLGGQSGDKLDGQSVGQSVGNLGGRVGGRKDEAALANNLQESNNEPLVAIRNQQQAGMKCPGQATCLPQSQYHKKCEWSRINLQRASKTQKQVVVAMINLLQGNQDYNCKLGRKEGWCCPAENECYFDKDNRIPKPLLHNQCMFLNRRCVKNGKKGICQKNGVCTTSAVCLNAAKPICNEERRCALCKLNKECFAKSDKTPFCIDGKCATGLPSYEDVDGKMFLTNCKRPASEYHPSYGSLYRTLRQDEDLKIGIKARKPKGTLTPVQHVGGAGGTGKDSQTQWISFTTDVEKAVVHSTRSLFHEDPLKKNRHGKLIEAKRTIQVSQKYLLSIGCTVVDLTRNDVREEYGLLEDNVQANAAAKNSASSCEVLVMCPVAIKIEGIEQKGQFDSHGTQLDPKKRASIYLTDPNELETKCEYTFPNTGHHQAKDNNSEHCR